ncbi:MAG: TauD/TfdA family dioxygenase [Alphaproteobacteria bacterium]|jgi:taurine dioxygenase|nr:TauD/TfdA family dioxygenase [Alphaproteobacteria bacterium]
MTVTVTPLEGPVGCLIEGVDPSAPLDDADFAAIRQAMVDHVAFVIPDMPDDPEWLLDFGRRFGPLVPHILDQFHHPLSSEISIIAMHMGDETSRKTPEPAGAYWHSDQSYDANPSDAIFLYATRIPSDGGETLAANMYLAYETLPRATKRRIAGKTAIHRYGWAGGPSVTGLTPEQQARYPDVEHPVVRVHALSGRKVLFVNPGFTVRILGIEQDESDDLLAELFEHQLRPEFQYRHIWSVGQLLGVDNRASIHCAVYNYTEPRRMLRMIVGCTEGTLRAA